MSTEVLSESVPCPVCGANATRPLFAGNGFAMGACTGCGLVRQNPRVTAAWIRQHVYDAEPGRSAEADRRRRPRGLAPWETKPQEAYLAGVDAVETFRDARAPRGVWLDVGCQTGGMLVAARVRGFTAVGVDVDSSTAEFCRTFHGFDARAGTLVEAAFPDGFAEVVSYRQVLEHVHDLAAELAEARRVLRPGGWLLVEVPHHGGVKFRLDALRARLRLLDRRRTLPNVPQHLYYFAARHLLRLLEAAGFEPLCARTYGRHRRRRSVVRRTYERVRDGLRLGNKLRVVARGPGPPRDAATDRRPPRDTPPGRGRAGSGGEVG